MHEIEICMQVSIKKQRVSKRTNNRVNNNLPPSPPPPPLQRFELSAITENREAVLTYQHNTHDTYALHCSMMHCFPNCTSKRPNMISPDYVCSLQALLRISTLQSGIAVGFNSALLVRPLLPLQWVGGSAAGSHTAVLRPDGAGPLLNSYLGRRCHD